MFLYYLLIAYIFMCIVTLLSFPGYVKRINNFYLHNTDFEKDIYKSSFIIAGIIGIFIPVYRLSILLLAYSEDSKFEQSMHELRDMFIRENKKEEN